MELVHVYPAGTWLFTAPGLRRRRSVGPTRWETCVFRLQAQQETRQVRQETRQAQPPWFHANRFSALAEDMEWDAG